ncbi:MAG: carbamoyl-phosphate synthase large subunit, partial [Halothiobacillus sp.]|nr:carbamoyl-phosphate synthase large subunit [Halothiobacillus sp.]
YTLDELRNEITQGATPVSFEPTIDYVVTKVPRFTFEKFPQADSRLTTQMKSVGEVMAIGRTFQESLQKALRGLEIGVDGFDEILDRNLNAEDAEDELIRQLREPRHDRLWYVADAFRHGFTLEDVHEHSKIDPWFLIQIEEIIRKEQELRGQSLQNLDRDTLWRIKRMGFSDRRLARLLDETESTVRAHRHGLGVRPVFKRVDTCAAEFPTDTAYLYSTYEQFCEAEPSQRDKIMILGGGPNRIGQGIEFDYCCVHAALALREDGFETIMVNCNPETVSTDYDISDRLYFESLTLEDVLEIIEVEKPKGVIVQFGGQTPLKLARDLEKAGAPIIGTTPDAIDRAEDRERFQSMIQELGLKQPPNRTARSADEAINLAAQIGYPLVVRPSYVLGGRAMEIVHNEEGLKRYMRDAVKASNDSPVLLDRFLDDATEMDIDAVSDGETVVIGGLMEHIEMAGVHSGDSACSLPPYTVAAPILAEVRAQVTAMAKALNVVGLMNTQVAIQGNDIYIIEVNPRASRTVPFVSKAVGIPLAKIAARAMAGISLAKQSVTRECVPPYYAVKEAVFPFIKFAGVDPLLGPEMKSTGEVMGIGREFGEAFAKAQAGAGNSLPTSGLAFVSVRKQDYFAAAAVAKALSTQGFTLCATRGTARHLAEQGLTVEPVNKVTEGRPNIVDMIKNKEITLIINTTTSSNQSRSDSFQIRREALHQRVPYFTTMAGAEAMALALAYLQQPISVNRLQDLHKECEV